MTLSNTSSEIVASGDGMTYTFNYDFPMPSASFAMLIYTDTTGSTSSVSSSLFSVSGAGPTSSGGTFTYPLTGSAVATGTSLTFQRVVPLTQNAAIGNQGNFYPSTVEAALDYQTMALQQLQQQIVDLQEALNIAIIVGVSFGYLGTYLG